jgi:hypothetical protein
MAIGNQVNLGTSELNTEIAHVAIEFHNAAQHAKEFFERINSLGVAGLQNIGFTANDAQTFFDTSNQMNTAAGVWYGTLAQNPAFNFDDATAKVR